MQKQTRRDFLKTVGFTAFSILPFSGCLESQEIAQISKQPNIILVLTDDQGFGDLGVHGNDKIKTPNIDNFAKQSVEFTQFYTSPVCTPTRASLMTGRYNFRTRAIDTYMGRAMMDPDEVTIAEILKSAGYKTGIFGKWHLGDNYPMRAIDQGFDEALVILGGGLCQHSDLPGGNGYFDPVLMDNGKPKQYKGYCMDIYTDHAIDFIKQNRNKPFFLYLPTNTPHTPLMVSKQYSEPYEKMGLDANTAKLYGMITNIDDNFGRVLNVVKNLGLEENTIMIFMTDNGPCPSAKAKGRFMAGLRGSKATVYENGIRVPFFIRWPKAFTPDKKINTIAAHIDVLPTLLDACHVNKPAELKLDGMSLLPLIENSPANWPDRELFFQWHRGDKPELYRCFAVRNQQYKLLQAAGIERPSNKMKFELYDISKDPDEKNDIADKHPDIVEKMKRDYEAWFKDVTSTRPFEPPRIQLGTPHENPTILTTQDWRYDSDFDKTRCGNWFVKIAVAGSYDIMVILSSPLEVDGSSHLTLADKNLTSPLKKDSKEFVLKSVSLPQCDASLKAWAQTDSKIIPSKFIKITRTSIM